jgi:hypothetical protein
MCDRTCCVELVFFVSGVIYRSCIVFGCVQGAKRRHTIFHARVSLLHIPKKQAGTHYAELVFLHLVQSMGYVVCLGASEARNIDTIIFML